jgi:hypothetical protein
MLAKKNAVFLVFLALLAPELALAQNADSSNFSASGVPNSPSGSGLWNPNAALAGWGAAINTIDNNVTNAQNSATVAQIIAGNAQNSANAAQGAANTAEGLASSAQNTANTALQTMEANAPGTQFVFASWGNGGNYTGGICSNNPNLGSFFYGSRSNAVSCPSNLPYFYQTVTGTYGGR